MLSGEGNENGEKTKIGLISKKATLHVNTLFCTFLCRCFGRLQRKTSRNFLVTRFMKELSYVFLFTFFSLLLIFTLVAATISHFHRRYKMFMLFFQQKMTPLFFISRSNSLSPFFSPWASLACRPLSLFHCSQDPGGYAILRQNNIKLHLGCHTCYLSYFTLVFLWCGQTGGREDGHVITKISRMGRLPHFLRYGATLARKWSPAKIFIFTCEHFILDH